MPDTGAMMCIAGVNIIHALGIKKHELYPVSTKISAANNRLIPTVGSLFLEMRIGEKVCKQLVYVTDQVKCIFPSKRACRDLGTSGRSSLPRWQSVKLETVRKTTGGFAPAMTGRRPVHHHRCPEG